MNNKYIKCYPCGLNDNPWMGNGGTCQGWDQNTQKFKEANNDDYIICSDVGQASYGDLHGSKKISDNYVSRGCGTQDIVNTKTSLLQRLVTPKNGIRKLEKHLRIKDRNKQIGKKEKIKKRRHKVARNWNKWGRWVFIGVIISAVLVFFGYFSYRLIVIRRTIGV